MKEISPSGLRHRRHGSLSVNAPHGLCIKKTLYYPFIVGWIIQNFKFQLFFRVGQILLVVQTFLQHNLLFSLHLSKVLKLNSSINKKKHKNLHFVNCRNQSVYLNLYQKNLTKRNLTGWWITDYFFILHILFQNIGLCACKHTWIISIPAKKTKSFLPSFR